MPSNAAPGHSSGKRAVGVSGPAHALWLRLLRWSATAALLGLAVTAAVAVVLNGSLGALSVALGGALVMAFFAISLLIGHFVGRNNPSGAVGLFVATYFVKVVGFAVVLFLIGAPAWLHGRWFVIGAVVAVVFWQAAELYAFSKARLQIFNDPSESAGGGHVQP